MRFSLSVITERKRRRDIHEQGDRVKNSRGEQREAGSSEHVGRKETLQR